MMHSAFSATPEELLDHALEALRRSGYSDLTNGHPEDLAAAIVPAIEAVALGFSWGYRTGRQEVK